MKIKKYKINRWYGALPLAVVLLTLAFSSCTKEPLLPSEQSNTEYIDFVLELTPPGAFTPAATRAISPDQQNAINGAVVLVFKDNKLLYHKIGVITNTDGVTKRVYVNLKTSQSESELFDIMVIGNPPNSALFNFASYVGLDKNVLKERFNVPSRGRWAGTEFIMYGEALQTLIKPATNNFKIQMLRSLARVDIGVGEYDEATDSWAGLAGVFSLTHVLVVNTRNQFAAIPAATTHSSTGNVKVSAPTIPENAAVQGTTALTAITYFSGDITKVGVNGVYTKSTIFIAEAPNVDKRVTLLVGGSYKGSDTTTFYRIDMCVPKVGALNESDYFNILRNHLYRITITGVTGPGFADREEALISAPINITTALTPIEEGGTSDIIFDGNNYLRTDVSSVLIYGAPDGVKIYPIVTVKANFRKGVVAKITGPGITPSMNLQSDVSLPISSAIPAGMTTGSFTITVGKLTKIIPFTVQPAVDAHFDFLPFANVASITVENPQPWLTLSHNMTFVKSEQQSSSILGNSDGKACFHFDENIETTSVPPRTVQALVQRNDNRGTTRVYFEQRNLSGMILGYFGGAKDAQGYTKQLAVESVEEFRERVYDDTSIGITVKGISWGFYEIITSVTEKISGREGTITLAKRTDSGIAAPYTIYNNYAARYCYEKNRGTGINGQIQDKDVLWYLPAQNQLMAAWIANAVVQEYKYWSATEASKSFAWRQDFHLGLTSYASNAYIERVRCVREL